MDSYNKEFLGLAKNALNNFKLPSDYNKREFDTDNPVCDLSLRIYDKH